MSSSDATILKTKTMDEEATLAPAHQVLAKGREGLTSAHQVLERVDSVVVRSWQEASVFNQFTKLIPSSFLEPHPRQENAEHTVRAPTLKSLKKKIRADRKEEKQLGQQSSEISRNIERLRSVIMDGCKYGPAWTWLAALTETTPVHGF